MMQMISSKVLNFAFEIKTFLGGFIRFYLTHIPFFCLIVKSCVWSIFGPDSFLPKYD